jgi:uncharacterized membrane protein
LDRSVAEGIITAEQAAQMGDGAGVRVELPGRSRRKSVVVEALGYLGGAIVVVSSLIIGARYWGEVGTGSRLTVLGCAALGLLVAGAGVPARMAAMGDRLRSVLWLASTVAFACFLTVLAVDAFGLSAPDVTLLVAAGPAGTRWCSGSGAVRWCSSWP